MKPTPAAKAAKSTAFPPEIIEVEEALVQDSTWWYFVDDHDHDGEFFDGLGDVYIDDGVDVDDDNTIDHYFEINAMGVLMQNSTWWSYNGHTCIRRGVRSDAQLSPTETRFQKCSQSGKNGSKHPMLSIPMAFNVISCKKVERNTQKLKISDFTM